MNNDLHETEKNLAAKLLRYHNWLIKNIEGITPDKALESATRIVLAEGLKDIDKTLWRQGVKINKEE